MVHLLPRSAATLSIALVACSSAGSKPVDVRDQDVVGSPRGPLEGRLRIQPADSCGGAAPAEDHESPPLAPRTGVVLRVMTGEIYGDDVLVATVTTDKDGKFSAGQLPAGKYCIAREHGPKPTQAPSDHHELACLVKRWESCDAIAVVPVKKPVLIDIYEPCSWSICYHGPKPP